MRPSNRGYANKPGAPFALQGLKGAKKKEKHGGCTRTVATAFSSLYIFMKVWENISRTLWLIYKVLGKVTTK